MDRNFFEFWGQLFLNAAKGQKQVEEMNQLLRQGLEGYESVRTLFQTIYGLKTPDDSPADQTAFWRNAEENFRDSFRRVLSLWGVVFREDYDAMCRKCEALTQKAAEQEQTIHHLQALLGDRQAEAFSVTQSMQSLLAKQQKDFQALVAALGLPPAAQKDKAPARKRR